MSSSNTNAQPNVAIKRRHASSGEIGGPSPRTTIPTALAYKASVTIRSPSFDRALWHVTSNASPSSANIAVYIIDTRSRSTSTLKQIHAPAAPSGLVTGRVIVYNPRTMQTPNGVYANVLSNNGIRIINIATTDAKRTHCTTSSLSFPAMNSAYDAFDALWDDNGNGDGDVNVVQSLWETDVLSLLIIYHCLSSSHPKQARKIWNSEGMSALRLAMEAYQDSLVCANKRYIELEGTVTSFHQNTDATPCYSDVSNRTLVNDSGASFTVVTHNDAKDQQYMLACSTDEKDEVVDYLQHMNIASTLKEWTSEVISLHNVSDILAISGTSPTTEDVQNVKKQCAKEIMERANWLESFVEKL